MLLSFGKAAKASSSLDGLPPGERLRRRRPHLLECPDCEPGEWLSVDLGKSCRIDAVQVNFAEHESTALAGTAELYHQYRLEWSLDGKTWEMLADRSGQPHRCAARLHTACRAGGGAVRADHQRPHAGRRAVFDSRPADIRQRPRPSAPARRPRFEVHRDTSDARNAVVRWEMSARCRRLRGALWDRAGQAVPEPRNSRQERDCSARSEWRSQVLLRGGRVQRFRPKFGKPRSRPIVAADLPWHRPPSRQRPHPIPPGSWRLLERCGERSEAKWLGETPRAGDGRRSETLRRPGLRGLIAVRIPAASDLVGIYEDVGTRLDGASSVPSFRFSTSVSRGSAITAIRTSPGCFPFERKFFPPVSST